MQMYFKVSDDSDKEELLMIPAGCVRSFVKPGENLIEPAD